KLPVDLRMGRVPDEAHRPVEVAKQIIAAEEALAGEQGQQRVLERHGFPLDSMCGVTLCASEHYVSDCIRRCAHIEPRRGCEQGRWRLRDAGLRRDGDDHVRFRREVDLWELEAFPRGAPCWIP